MSVLVIPYETLRLNAEVMCIRPVGVMRSVKFSEHSSRVFDVLLRGDCTNGVCYVGRLIKEFRKSNLNRSANITSIAI